MEHISYFELNFRPNFALVSIVRRFVSDSSHRFLGDADGVARVALATHELLENAVKHSTDGETTVRIEVEEDGASNIVRILLRNRAVPSNIASIMTILDGVVAADDAGAYYQALIKQRSRIKEGSGLGLARICAEAEMKVTCQVVDTDIVEIRATTTVGGGRS